ncbi:MAG: FAD-dependent oxidoreductase [Candidatus Niyogibacteria bacterium]|nr:FAD-dependent oxidoreductase [Candidatus Niyogibacteria bacterium]
MPKRYCIIGGGIAGITAAETIRAHDGEGDILVISAEPHPLYSRVSLPAYVSGELERERVMMRTLRDYAERNIRLFPSERVIEVRPRIRGRTSGGEVKTASGKTFEYDALLIATGGRPVEWPHDEVVSERIFRLHTLDDALRLREFFNRHPARFASLASRRAGTPASLAKRGESARRSVGRVIVAGGGFIALELAEIFRTKKFDVTFLVRGPQFWSGKWVDPADHDRLTDLWKKNGVRAIFGDAVREMEENNGAVRIRTTAGRDIVADCVAIAIGIECEPDFVPRKILGSLASKNLEARLPNGVVVNKYLETEFPNVWAAGDAMRCAADGEPQGSQNWSSAVLSGQAAGMNMMGEYGRGTRKVFRLPPRYSVGHFGAVLKWENGRSFFKSNPDPEGSPRGG